MGNGNNQYKMYDFSDEKVMQIQRYYDDGHSMKDIVKKFGTSICKLYSLRDKGRLNLHRTKEQSKEIGRRKREGFKHTEKTKKILSEKRKQWIAENPDKSPYIMAHKSRGETFAERYFREWLEKEQIPFQQEYHFGLYAFDFLVNERIDLEIDGGQHRNDKRIIKHDEKRDAKSKDGGFIVYRIFWSDYKRLSQEEKEKFLGELKDFLLDDTKPIPQIVIKNRGKDEKRRMDKAAREGLYSIFVEHKVNESLYQYDYRAYMALEMYKNDETFTSISKEFDTSTSSIGRWICSICDDKKILKKLNNNKKHGTTTKKNPTPEMKQEALELLKSGMPYLMVGKFFGVSDNAIRKWIQSLGENPKDYGNRSKKNKQK